MIIAISIVISFLCGSIPTGYLVAKKSCGIDIRVKGSGNIGSTNVKRIIGTKLAIITQVIDVIKGIVPVALGICLAKTIEIPMSMNSYISIIAIINCTNSNTIRTCILFYTAFIYKYSVY